MSKKVMVPCPHCGKPIDLHEISFTSEGFKTGTIGAYIAFLVTEAGEEGITKKELSEHCFQRYGDEHAARVSSVVNKLVRGEKAKTLGLGRICTNINKEISNECGHLYKYTRKIRE